MAGGAREVKISDIRIDVVRRELPAHSLLDGIHSAHPVEQGVLRVFTDEGVEGNCLLGAWGAWIPAESHFRPILDVIKPELVGREPFEREWLWNRMQFLASRLRLREASWAPVDVALWDIAGKVADLPVYKLLGAQRNRIPAYASYLATYDSVDGFVDEAKETFERGFRAYKIHPGRLGPRDVAEMACRVRELADVDVPLMLDPNCGYNFRCALEVGHALDDNRFHWYEDPVRHHDIDAIAELSRRLRTPLSMTDQSEAQLFDSARYIRRQALRIVRGTALRLGITGLRKLCSLAESYGLQCEIGTAGNALLNAANLHVMLSVRNCEFYEHLMPVEHQDFALTGYPEPDGEGMVRAPAKPGLGFELDPDWIAHHRVASLR